MLWKQLAVVDGVLYRTYHPGPSEEAITVPILPSSIYQETLTFSHDIPTAGYLGIEKTLDRLRKNAYWVGCRAQLQELYYLSEIQTYATSMCPIVEYTNCSTMANGCR